MLGYFFYGLTLLIVIGFTIFSASKPSLSGENGMGYGLGLAFFGLAFAISSLILTLSVGWKGGFDWVSNQNFNRNILVGFGLGLYGCCRFCLWGFLNGNGTKAISQNSLIGLLKATGKRGSPY